MAKRGVGITKRSEFDRCRQNLTKAAEHLETLVREMQQAKVNEFPHEAKTLFAYSDSVRDYAFKALSKFKSIQEAASINRRVQGN